MSGPPTDIEDRILAPVYQHLPVMVTRGLGAEVWDQAGRVYLDCMAGYGVAILGHCHPRIVDAVRRQAGELITCHGSLYNPVRAELLEKLGKIAPPGLERAYLANSGAEAVECALKAAVRRTARKKLVAMTGGYHGKSLGALAVTWGRKYREHYQALLAPTVFVPYGDNDALAQAVDSETAAVIVEPVQGESGVHVPPAAFLQLAREVCDQTGAVLIHDEIQSGLGRTGRLWAGEHSGVVPDVLCIGKGIAGGLPMGVTLGKSEVQDAFAKGEHTSTFGGNPLVCAAASATIDILMEGDLLAQVRQRGAAFLEGLRLLATGSRLVREARGIGLMLALELRQDFRPSLLRALEEGLLLLYSGYTILRLLPPLVITTEQAKRALSILDRALQGEAAEVRPQPEPPAS